MGFWKKAKELKKKIKGTFFFSFLFSSCLSFLSFFQRERDKREKTN